MAYPNEPTPTPVGARLRERTQPLAPNDADYGYAHAWLTEAIGALFLQAQQVGDPEGVVPPLAVLLDPVLCPAWALPWLAQFVGLRIPAGVSEANARTLIRDAAGFRRGTVAAMRSAMAPFLAPGATVYFRERDGGDPYALEVRVQADDVPKTDIDWPTNLVPNPSSELVNTFGSNGTVPATPVNAVINPSFEDLAVGATPPATQWVATASGGNTPNIVPNPSGETTPTVVNFSASSSGQAAATVVDTTAWAKAGTHASRYTVVKTETSSCVARHATGTGGVAVTAGDWYAARVSGRLASISGGGATQVSYVCAIYFWDAAGAQVSSGIGPSFVTTIGNVADTYLIMQAPVGAVTATVGLRFTPVDTAGVPQTIVTDVDAFMLHAFGATWTGSSGVTTNPADVPPYADGDMPGFRWIGTAHNSSTGVQIAAGKADTNWTRPVGTKAIRYQATRTDAATCQAGTGGGAGLQANMFPVVGGHTYGTRISVRHRTPSGPLPPPGNVRTRIYWFDASGVACTPANSDSSGTTIGASAPFPFEIELSFTATAPANAAYARVAAYFQNPNNNSTTTPGLWYQVDADLDHFMCVDMAGSAGNYASVPAYFDGSMPGWKWNGTANASSSAPTATRTRVNDWAAVGAWSCRYQATRDDGGFGHTCRLDGNGSPNNGRIAINPSHAYAVRVTTRMRSGSAQLDDLRIQTVAFKADNVTQTGSNYYSPTTVPVPGLAFDMVGIFRYPSDAAWVAIRPSLNFPIGVATADVDFDAVAMYDLGVDYAGGTEAATNPADVPPYVDGSLAGCVWTGAAHASTSYRAKTTTLIADALKLAKPGGIVLGYSTIVGWDYQEQTLQVASYTADTAKGQTYQRQREGP